MSYKPISLSNLISIRKNELFLPHIQRPFVWSTEQVHRLMDSLMRNYPIQTFLFWKTRDHIKVRRFLDEVTEEDVVLSQYYDARVSEQGVQKTLVLDGQQRLQTLFAVFDGKVNGEDYFVNVLTGPKELDSGLHFEFSLGNPENRPELIRVKSLVDDVRNAFTIASEITKTLNQSLGGSAEDIEARRELVGANIHQLISLIREDKHFYYNELDGVAQKYEYHQILDIFVRINSGGTKLDAADLMFSAMKQAWEPIEENIESTVENLNLAGNLDFDKTFVLKGLMLVIGKGAVLAPDLFQGEKGDKNLAEASAAWPRAQDAFLHLHDFIQNELKIYSERVVRSYNAFLPIFEFFYYNPTTGSSFYPQLKSYYYRSQMMNWFSARTDALLNGLHNLLKDQTSFPLDAIKAYFRGIGKDVDFQDKHVTESSLRFLVLNLVYVEKHGTSPFNVQLKGNQPHIDHIYPKSKLKDRPTAEVNHIFNYRFFGGTDNIKKRAELPDSYFVRLLASGVDISKHLLVDDYSNDPAKLTLENYDDFFLRRGEKILELCQTIINK